MEEVHPFPNPMFEMKYCKFITFGNQVSERDRISQGLKIAVLGWYRFLGDSNLGPFTWHIRWRI